jgi:hypothetical protein
MGRSPAAVAGLLRRGLATLRSCWTKRREDEDLPEIPAFRDDGASP